MRIKIKYGFNEFVIDLAESNISKFKINEYSDKILECMK